MYVKKELEYKEYFCNDKELIKEIKSEIIELFRKHNLTFSQAYNIINSIRIYLERKSLHHTID